MATEADKIMFEIYRESEYDRQYRVVYFTELEDHNKESEISRAMAGEHFYDGFLSELRRDAGKSIINNILTRLNNGEALTAEQTEQALSEQGVLA